MDENRDESNRIRRLSSERAKSYLSGLKGKVYDEYRKNWEYCGANQIGLKTPLQLNIELTAMCNLKCKMCYRGYNLPCREGVLPLEDVKMLAKQFETMRIPSLWLSGGEPLMHPQIKDVLEIFSAVKPTDFWMVSNGLLLTQDVSRAIIQSELTWLSISIDASCEETYKAIRGGDYKKLMKNITDFLAIRSELNSKLPFLRVSFIKMEENEGELDDFIQQWTDKADIIDIQDLADYHDLEQFSMDDVMHSTYVCTAPFVLLSVLPNGDIIPCCNGFYREKSRFNIHNISFAEYWESDYHCRFAQSIKDKHYCQECIDCIKSFLPRKQRNDECKKD